jgi:hypothetical protein
MSLLFCESFGHYRVQSGTWSTSATWSGAVDGFRGQLANKWTAMNGPPFGSGWYLNQEVSGSGNTHPVPSGSGYALQTGTTLHTIEIDVPKFRRNIPTQANTIHIGMRIWLHSLERSGSIVRVWPRTTTGAIANDAFSLNLDPSGALRLTHPNGLSLLSNTTISIETWNYIEIRLGAGVGAEPCQLRINEVAVTGTGSGPSLGYMGGIVELRDSGPFGIGFADFYLADDQGTQNNDYLGDVLIVPVFPNEDDEVDFTPLEGTDNFAMVNDEPPEGPRDDEAYNVSDVPEAQDLFLSDGTGFLSGYEVRGIQSVVRARKLDSGYGPIRHVIKSGDDEAEGDLKPISNVYQNHTHVFELDPATGEPFTLGSVNDLSFGYKIEPQPEE